MRRLIILLVSLVLCASAAQAANAYADALPLRNHNPFLQIFGLPPFATAGVTAAGSWDVDLAIDLANDADQGQAPNESAEIDMESHLVALSLRRRVGERLELGIYVPCLRNTGGFLDDLIKDWHSLLSLSNTKRAGPSDQLLLRYERDGETVFLMDRPASGIGDVQLHAALPLRRVTVRASVKLPTGDAASLHGSGATDVALAAHAARKLDWRGHELQLSGFVGGIALGKGEVLTDLQRSFVPYAGLALRWQAMERLGLVTQLQLQGPYFDSDVEEIGTESLQLGVGFDYRLGRDGPYLRLAIAEDINSRATPDFALHLSIGR